MSDSYLALVDPTADATNAEDRAEKLRNALVRERIILPETNEQCVYGGVGHPPGPRLNEAYVFSDGGPDWPPELRYWDMLDVCGVRITTEKWVNFFAFPVFEWAKCPECQEVFGADSEVMNPVMDAVAEFINEEQSPVLACPSCGVRRHVRAWSTEPHLGVCHLAAEFWNWPDFNAKGWQISVPDIASKAVGVELVPTYGRM